jgi:hypothetical protein
LSLAFIFLASTDSGTETSKGGWSFSTMITRAISVLLLVVLSANSLNYKRVKGKNNLEAKLFSAELFKKTSSPYAV